MFKKLLAFLRWIGRQTTWLVVILTLGLVVGGLAIYFFDAPNTLDLGKHPLKETSIIYDRTGKIVLYEIHGEENRRVISHEAIPNIIRDATIAAEDAHFYTHPGVDVFAILRAAFVNFQSNEIEQGASTITQQLARSLFLTREKTWVRKAREVMLAVKIESQYTKDEILDLYLNTVPYGSNAYGMDAAARTFFGKTASDLTLDEAVVLAALPNAPSALSPYGNGKNDLITRKNTILEKMHSLGSITQAEMEAAKSEKTLAKVTPLEHHIVAPHFVFFVRERLEALYGKERLETEGLKIVTTIDLDLQKKAEDIVTRGVQKNFARGASNAALTAVDPTTGEILVMVGSRDYFDTKIDGQVNVANEKRQPGSTFKPFAYATAFTKGFQPETRVYDIPINFGPDGSGKDYIPNDYDGKFRGPLSMREALAQSLNIPAVTTLYLAGVKDTIALATKMGITTLTDPDRYGLALVLGGAEVKLVDMVSAFGVFGQEGVRHPADSILRVMNRDGKDLYERDTHGTMVIPAEVTIKINSILSDNAARTPIFGPNSPLAFKDKQVAAKTGTTQNFRDAWTVGYTRKIAAGVWTGNNDNTPMEAGADGVFVAAPIWREFMNVALERFPETGFTPYVANVNTATPANLSGETKVVYIDKKTGKKLSPEKAKKKRQSSVDIIVTDGYADLPADRKDGQYIYQPRSIQDLNKIYFPNGR
ncbi:MAG: PBP1A family penicillin-binding protein [Candidatus Moraniibacteriota bacterium]